MGPQSSDIVNMTDEVVFAMVKNREGLDEYAHPKQGICWKRFGLLTVMERNGPPYASKDVCVWMLEACTCVDACACLPACPNNIIKCKRCIPAKAASPKADIEQVSKLLQCPQKGLMVRIGKRSGRDSGQEFHALFAMSAGGCTSIAIGVFRNVWNRELTDFLVPPQAVKTESAKLKPGGKA